MHDPAKYQPAALLVWFTIPAAAEAAGNGFQQQALISLPSSNQQSDTVNPFAEAN